LAGHAEGSGDRWPVEALAYEAIDLGIDLSLGHSSLVDESPEASRCLVLGDALRIRLGPVPHHRRALFPDAAALALTHRLPQASDAAA
jgi:hypothetical protein